MRDLEILTTDNNEFIEWRMGGFYGAVSKDLEIMVCNYCIERKKSYKFRGYCHHVGDIYRNKFGNENYEKIYRPHIEMLKLRLLLKKLMA